jgi:hypothetical protein
MGLTVNRNLQHPARQRAAGASLYPVLVRDCP